MEFLKLFSNSLFERNLVINLFLGFVFIAISLQFFQTIFKIHFSRKNKVIYIVTNTICLVLGKLFMDYVCSCILMLISSIAMFVYLLKIEKAQTFAYFTLKSMILLNIQFFVFKIVHMLSNCNSYSEMIEFPIFGILSIIFMSLTGFILCICSKRLKLDKFLHFAIDKKSNLIIGISILNLVIIFSIFLYFFEILNQNVLSILALDLYFFFLITNMIQLCKISHMKQKIENLKICNKTILNMYDEIRAFRHDFHNILQAIGGYIATNDMEGLKKYYKDISNDCKNTNNLSKLNPSLINNPAIYNILANKYYIAKNHNIQINLDVMLDLNHLNMKIYELTRILGILLDNAIEASKECNEKNINISFKQDKYKQMLIIENTYSDKQLSIDKIFEKDFTTKPHNTGLGLWEVRKILSKNSNLNLHTSKNDDYFSQQLEIYTA